jgi:hypothetical protein
MPSDSNTHTHGAPVIVKKSASKSMHTHTLPYLRDDHVISIYNICTATVGGHYPRVLAWLVPAMGLVLQVNVKTWIENIKHNTSYHRCSSKTQHHNKQQNFFQPAFFKLVFCLTDKLYFFLLDLRI